MKVKKQKWTELEDRGVSLPKVILQTNHEELFAGYLVLVWSKFHVRNFKAN